MAKISIDKELAAICVELTKLYQGIIQTRDLIDTGALYKSIKWTYIKTGTNYSLEMTAKDYFKYLNKRFRVQSVVENSREYKRILKRIAKVVAEIKKQQIIEELNGINDNRNTR